MNTRSFLGALSIIVATAIFAGCSGSQMTPAAGGSGSGMQAHSPATLPSVKNHCTAQGGVRVDPCTVTFDASNYGPDTVTIRTPKTKKGTIVEKDDCGGASGIATVTQASGNDWTVAAGPTAGTCTAEFDFMSFKHDKLIGYALLSITNNL